MRTYIAHPHKGVDTLEFGMTDEDVRHFMQPSAVATEIRNQIAFDGSLSNRDYYHDEGVFFEYDDQRHLESVMFLRPAKVLLGGIDMLSLTMGQANAVVARLDPNLRVDVDGCMSFDLALGVWVEDTEEGENAPVTTVLVGRAGYYDSLRPKANEAGGQ